MLVKNPLLAVAVSAALMQITGENVRSGGGNGASAATSAGKRGFSKKEYDLDTGVVSFTFEPGTDNEEVIELNVLDLPQEIQRQLMLHGASQKGGDSYASVKGNVTQAKANLRDIISQLQSGEWRGAGDEARPRLAELAAAISRIRNAPLEKVTAAVEAANDQQRKDWRSNAQVKAMIAKIRAEKAAEQLASAGEQELNIDLQ